MRKTETEGIEERFVTCSQRIVLACDACGEKLVLLGREEDWLAEGVTSFDCECGEALTLADRADEESRMVRDLLRSSGLSSV